MSNQRTAERLVPHLHDLVALAELEQVDDGVLALSSDAGVFVFGVVQQALYQGLHQAHLQRGRLRLFPHPPQHPLRDQSDVAGLVLKTLGGGPEKSLKLQFKWFLWKMFGLTTPM